MTRGTNGGGGGGGSSSKWGKTKGQKALKFLEIKFLYYGNYFNPFLFVLLKLSQIVAERFPIIIFLLL